MVMEVDGTLQDQSGEEIAVDGKKKYAGYVISKDSGVSNSNLTGQEPFAETGDYTKTFTKPMHGFVIKNDGEADLTFEINGDTYTIKKGEGFAEYLKPFTVVNIATAGSFRAYGLGD